MRIRPATRDDLDAMAGADSIARDDAGRRAYLLCAIEAGGALVAVDPDGVTGYAILDHAFFGNAFLSLLVVRPDARRKGVGTALVRACESLAHTPKLFTSTNASNEPMQRLLDAAGFERSGVIENLDPDDPELVYVRFLGEEAA